MEIVLIALITNILFGVDQMLDLSNGMFEQLYANVFKCEDYLTTITGVNFFELLTQAAYGIGFSLIILKFLKKAFDVYVLWTDGDPDADPLLLLTNFVRAIATALVFQWLYGIFTDVFDDVLDMFLDAVNANTSNYTVWVNMMAGGGIVPSIAALIFIICWLILFFSFMARGVEMMVMRAGVPIACAGLLDNDKGVFKAYFNQFVKAFATTVIQIILCKIGLHLMLGATAATAANIFWGIACMIAALSMPKILREFLLPTGGDGHIMNNVSQTVHTTAMIKNIVTK